MRDKIYLFGGALLFGAIGFGIAFGGWHLYQDHQNHHELINMVIRAQQAQQPKPVAAPTPESK